MPFDYKIVTANIHPVNSANVRSCALELSIKVRELMNQGWKLVGGISTSTSDITFICSQALMLEKE
jgi:hypothetical protein